MHSFFRAPFSSPLAMLLYPLRLYTRCSRYGQKRVWKMREGWNGAEIRRIFTAPSFGSHARVLCTPCTPLIGPTWNQSDYRSHLGELRVTFLTMLKSVKVVVVAVEGACAIRSINALLSSNPVIWKGMDVLALQKGWC